MFEVGDVLIRKIDYKDKPYDRAFVRIIENIDSNYYRVRYLNGISRDTGYYIAKEIIDELYIKATEIEQLLYLK